MMFGANTVEGVASCSNERYLFSMRISLDIEIENFDMSLLSESNRRVIEADSYWATSHLLENIQDNYTFAQPGIQYKVRTLEELVKRIDGLFKRKNRIV